MPNSRRYDVVVNTRIDVLFTHAVPPSLYEAVAARHREGKELVVIPRWAGFGGYNDRFAVSYEAPCCGVDALFLACLLFKC